MIKPQQAYQTNLNNTEWDKIASYFPVSAMTGRTRRHSFREILNVIFYITRSDDSINVGDGVEEDVTSILH